MGYGNYTIIYEQAGISYKLCRIFFGADGSYYVTSPYHPEGKAALVKATVNYSLAEMYIPFEQAIDIASAEDDEKRIKFSHHPDGFVQFSGDGVVSGKDADGNIRGVGIMSWPLDRPVIGPAFGIALRDIEQFEQVDRLKGELCIFRHEEITTTPGAKDFGLEGYYFPPLWRRFVRSEPDGTKTIQLFIQRMSYCGSKFY